MGRSTRWLLILAALLGASCESRSVPKKPQVIKTKTGVEMVLIPAGWFEMGSRDGEADEAPVHRVWIDAFLIDRYEVTQEQYDYIDRYELADDEHEDLILGNPSHFKGAKRPVEQVSWVYAALFCNKRSRVEGLQPCYDTEAVKCDFEANGYRLPAEAEWEYACRAGTRTEHYFGRDARLLKAHAWCAENSGKKTHPVGLRRPNAWGLFDMYGNVVEWCNDIYDKHYYANSPERSPRGPAKGGKYVLRGGAWNSRAHACRSAYRVGEGPGFEDACFPRDAIGFRCVRRAPRNLAALEAAKDNPHPRTGFVYDDIYLRHKTGPGHPDRPQRLVAIVQRLREKGLLSQVAALKPAAAVRRWLTTVHTSRYVERVRRSCEEGAEYVDSRDVPISAESYKVAVAAVGGVLSAIDAVVAGRIRNAFCAIRPPGHHALKDEATGFCLFNNVAIAARYVQRRHKLAKVLIVDWDVHHGNGTQEVFYDDPSVLYFGVHQYPFYPGTGSAEEKGAGKGLNYTLNVPLPAGSGDREYKKVFRETLEPAALAFKPDFVLISAGFDAHKDDLLGGMKVSTKGFAELTRIVKAIAERCCKGRLVSVLEGGYTLEDLAASVEAHLRVLMK